MLEHMDIRSSCPSLEIGEWFFKKNRGVNVPKYQASNPRFVSLCGQKDRPLDDLVMIKVEGQLAPDFSDLFSQTFI